MEILCLEGVFCLPEVVSWIHVTSRKDKGKRPPPGIIPMAEKQNKMQSKSLGKSAFWHIIVLWLHTKTFSSWRKKRRPWDLLLFSRVQQYLESSNRISYYMIDFCTSARDLPLTFVHYCSSSTARWRTSKSEKKTLKNLHQRTESQERLAGKVYALVNQWKPLSPPQIQNNWVSMAVTWILLSSLHIKPHMFKGYSNYSSFIPTPSIFWEKAENYPRPQDKYTGTPLLKFRGCACMYQCLSSENVCSSNMRRTSLLAMTVFSTSSSPKKRHCVSG